MLDEILRSNNIVYLAAFILFIIGGILIMMPEKSIAKLHDAKKNKKKNVATVKAYRTIGVILLIIPVLAVVLLMYY